MTMLTLDSSMSTLLMSAPPDMTEAVAEGIADEYFGIRASARRLTSERDANFRLTSSDGHEFILKVTNEAESRELTNLQTSALLHIQMKNPNLPVPRIMASVDGRYEVPLADGRTTNVVRLLTYLKGDPLHAARSTAKQRENVGYCLAELGLALRSFEHPAGNHDLLWDIKNVAQLRPLVDFIDDRDRRSLADQFLCSFEEIVVPRIGLLRNQIIHNDFNPHNILVDAGDHATISGILDFGDIVLTPLINDLAVAASYHVAADGHPLHGAADLVKAYHSVSPLQALELDLLFDLIAARLVTTVIITHWRAHQHPSNREYILRNNPRAWVGLERFANISRADARGFFVRACGLE